MSDIVRVSVSIERPLFRKLEGLVGSSHYQNRSKFIRDLILDHLVQREWRANEELLGTISLVYDHHARGLSQRLIRQQHRFRGRVLATTHVHLDEHLCAEMLMVRGRGKDIQALTNRLQREKGVLHAILAAGTTGKHLRCG